MQNNYKDCFFYQQVFTVLVLFFLIQGFVKLNKIDQNFSSYLYGIITKVKIIKLNYFIVKLLVLVVKIIEIVQSTSLFIERQLDFFYFKDNNNNKWLLYLINNSNNDDNNHGFYFIFFFLYFENLYYLSIRINKSNSCVYLFILVC